MAELPFALIHQEDAAAAIVRAVTVAPDAAVNVAAPGAVTPYQAVRLGGGVPVPVDRAGVDRGPGHLGSSWVRRSPITSSSCCGGAGWPTGVRFPICWIGSRPGRRSRS